MASIQPVRYPIDSSNAAQVKADSVQASGAFGQVLKDQQSQPSEVDQHVQAILNFYDIHQRSQITGVPISEYKAAVAALGLDPEKDTFAAINLLQEKGFETGAPSLAAILKYGAAPQVSGNQSYLAQVDETSLNVTNLPDSGTPALVQVQLDDSEPEVVDQRPDLSAVTQEIQTLNQKFGEVLGPSKNYFEAVTHLSKQLDIAPYQSMSLSQALPMIAAALETHTLGITTDQWLKGKG